MKRYLTRREVAEIYPISESSLAQLAMRGEGPRYFMPQNRALYLAEDVEEWIEAHAVIARSRPMLRSRKFIEEKPVTLQQAPGPKAETTRREPIQEEPKKVGAQKGKKRGRRRKSLVPSANSWLRNNPDHQ
ncbi:helix-turn-helix transcriptional regulator [Stappia taiwanensis]